VSMALRFALLMLAAALGGCATTAGSGATPPAKPAAASAADPWEGLNRKIFAFNDAVDAAVLKPVAEGYRAVVPSLVRAGVDNVFGNISDAWSAVNHLLQGKAQAGSEMTMRFVTNSFFGLGGLLDPATDLGMERQREDFGQTLGRWGLAPGPYIVLPFLGPSSLRDATGFALDREASLGNLVTESKYANWITVTELISVRASLLSAGGLLDQIAIDKYSFLRDAYLARRRNQVFDGNPPPEPEDEPPPAPTAAK
jgi:phospholipid-binding lipoprotein MlaA